ncbi:methyltransferase, FxLD system [Actinomadura geliboluensis]|uniref:Protein-L-isoaspartate O-methyltransferase n=2 Tax=Actinomadura geliboluensis TaxID=882440 RepID=A0A5S4G3P5_9ACTN|nr:methyltransferase, FxLD system [Actinomadura geliboluensis]TMR27462.1 methyltransferase, FxLD system [Actinomadura geliboluensis]
MTDDSNSAARMRHELAETLLTQGQIVSPAVEKAFRTVPREMFVPAGTPLDVVYSVDSPVITKIDEHGAHISSVSATYIQVRMIEMSGLAPGMTVLEIGSGGYNAALLAEVVEPDGHVVSVDIDTEITKRARDLLERAGYGRRVTIMQADAHHPIAGFKQFDRILVTVGAWDVLPAWLDQLAADGVLVVPLRMNGITRTIAFRRNGDHLTSIDVEVAGFVPMRGEGAHAERTFLLPDRYGKHIKLQFDSDVPGPTAELDGVLATDPVSVWSGVTIANGVSFADLHLWLAAFLSGFCRVGADPDTELASQLGKTWFPFGVVRGDSFAYLAVRPALDGGGVEFGATAYGSHGRGVAAALTEQIQAWDRHGRSSEPTFGFWPVGSPPAPPSGRSAVLTKRHGAVSISWPEAD